MTWGLHPDSFKRKPQCGSTDCEVCPSKDNCKLRLAFLRAEEKPGEYGPPKGG